MMCLIGPGSYEVGQKSTPRLKGIKEMDKYLVQDNGHVTQRTQPYSLQKKIQSSNVLLQPKIEPPGPGAYNWHSSDF